MLCSLAVFLQVLVLGLCRLRCTGDSHLNLLKTGSSLKPGAAHHKIVSQQYETSGCKATRFSNAESKK